MLNFCNANFTKKHNYFLDELKMFEEIKKVLVESANVDANKVTMEANLKDDLAIDSLDAVELVLDLETKFDIKIEDEEIESLVTVADIVKLVESKK